MQDDPDGTQISVLDTAAKMISISDNTAANMLINLVGRSAVQAQDRQWSDHAALNVPFLTTREAFILKLSLSPAGESVGPGDAQRRRLIQMRFNRQCKVDLVPDLPEPDRQRGHPPHLRYVSIPGWDVSTP